MSKEENYMDGIEAIQYAMIGGVIITKKVKLSWLIDESDDGMARCKYILAKKRNDS